MPYPLFETFCYENGELKNLSFHQIRFEKSRFLYYGQRHSPSLARVLARFSSFHTLPKKGLFRLRLAYNEWDFQLEISPYQRQIYRHFTPVYCDDIDYALKYTDRRLLNTLWQKRGKGEEIIIIKKGLVTDCRIGNLLFRHRQQWFTPNAPLLAGTQRAFLLAKGKIHLATIHATDLPQFEETRIINALNPL